MESKPSRFIGLEEVERRVNRGRAWIYAEMKLEKFPEKYRLGWLESDIDKYIEEIAMAHSPASTNNE